MSEPMTYLQQYLAARVVIHYSHNAYSDTGTLTYMDSDWVEITKDNGERLLTPTTAIRIIKLLETVQQKGAASELLRAADAPEPKRIGSE